MINNSRPAILRTLSGVLLACVLVPSAAGAAEDIVGTCGVRGGLVVCIGCDEPEFLTESGVNDSCLVHALDTDPVKVARARAVLRGRKLYGKISVDTWNGHLPGK